MRAAWLRQSDGSAKDKEKGFSLLELMVVVALAAILLGFAVPSFQGLLSRNHLTATTNTLVFSFQTARSEAIKRALRMQVVLLAAVMSLDGLLTWIPTEMVGAILMKRS